MYENDFAATECNLGLDSSEVEGVGHVHQCLDLDDSSDFHDQDNVADSALLDGCTHGRVLCQARSSGIGATNMADRKMFLVTPAEEKVLSRFKDCVDELTSADIGEAIKKLRASTPLTQEELAERLRLFGWGTTPSQNYISRIESGEKHVSIDRIWIVAKSVNTSVSRLFWEAERCAARKALLKGKEESTA